MFQAWSVQRYTVIGATYSGSRSAGTAVVGAGGGAAAGAGVPPPEGVQRLLDHVLAALRRGDGVGVGGGAAAGGLDLVHHLLRRARARLRAVDRHAVVVDDDRATLFRKQLRHAAADATPAAR